MSSETPEALHEGSAQHRTQEKGKRRRWGGRARRGQVGVGRVRNKKGTRGQG